MVDDPSNSARAIDLLNALDLARSPIVVTCKDFPASRLLSETTYATSVGRPDLTCLSRRRQHFGPTLMGSTPRSSGPSYSCRSTRPGPPPLTSVECQASDPVCLPASASPPPPLVVVAPRGLAMCRMVVFSGTCTKCGETFTWSDLTQELFCLEAKNSGAFGDCENGVTMDEHSFDDECDACADEEDEGVGDISDGRPAKRHRRSR
jgi:hypothetical protein